MPNLARKLRLTDYFTLGWGTMVGVGWLVVMDDWLLRGGSLGAVLGFAIGGALLFPIGWVYGRLVAAMPDAAGEIAYTAAAFSRPISFSTGWMMMLAYFIVCPWEAVAVGRIAGYIIPSLDSLETLPHRRTPSLSSAPAHRSRPHRSAHHAELSRHPPQRNLSELDVLRHAGPVYCFRRAWRKPRFAAQLSSALYSHAASFRSCWCCRSSRIS